MKNSDGPLAPIVEEVEDRADSGQPVSVETVEKAAGEQVAGPLLLVPALIAMTPLTVVPGVPSLIALNTVLVAGQIALGRKSIWLPKWLRSRKLSSKHTKKLLKLLKPLGKVADKMVKPRLQFLTAWPLRRIGAGLCVLVGACMPMTEVIPFTSTWLGATIATYALAITAKDGLLVVAWVGLILAIMAVASNLLF
jgi:hypothetical protein